MSLLNDFETKYANFSNNGRITTSENNKAAIKFLHNNTIEGFQIHISEIFFFAYGSIHDLGNNVLFRCSLTYSGYNLQANENKALYICNSINCGFDWLRLLLNDKYEFELKAKAIIDKNDWFNSVLNFCDTYINYAVNLFHNCCEEYGEVVSLL